MKYTPVQVRLAKNLNDLMTSKTLNGNELEKKSGVSRNTIYKYLNCDFREPNLRTCRKLADALGVSVGELLKESEEDV